MKDSQYRATRKDVIPLVEVTRSGVIECTHRGSIAIVENGSLVDSLGDPTVVTPMRSTAKPFQVLALLEAGGIEEFGLTLDEIAVMVSSHNGEPRHVQTVRNLLHKAGLDESSLHCGTHPAYFAWITRDVFRETGSDVRPVHNNCSGKHAGMLLLGNLLGTSLDSYWELGHPIQQTVLTKVAQVLGKPTEALSVGVDGCGVPTYNVTLTELAKMYCMLTIADPSASSDTLGVVQKAMMAEPFMVAGSDRLDTDLMKLGSFIGKVGSQGIYCIGVCPAKIAIAIKIESGSEEAGECAAVEILRKLGFLTTDALSSLEKYWQRPVETLTGRIVGQYRAIF